MYLQSCCMTNNKCFLQLYGPIHSIIKFQARKISFVIIKIASVMISLYYFIIIDCIHHVFCTFAIRYLTVSIFGISLYTSTLLILSLNSLLGSYFFCCCMLGGHYNMNVSLNSLAYSNVLKIVICYSL